jgi:hypothetical protein
MAGEVPGQSTTFKKLEPRFSRKDRVSTCQLFHSLVKGPVAWRRTQETYLSSVSLSIYLSFCRLSSISCLLVHWSIYPLSSIYLSIYLIYLSSVEKQMLEWYRHIKHRMGHRPWGDRLQWTHITAAHQSSKGYHLTLQSQELDPTHQGRPGLTLPPKSHRGLLTHCFGTGLVRHSLRADWVCANWCCMARS